MRHSVVGALVTLTALGNIKMALLLFAMCIFSSDAHSWVENVLTSYGEGASRVGMNTRGDVRYFMYEFGIIDLLSYF